MSDFSHDHPWRPHAIHTDCVCKDDRWPCEFHSGFAEASGYGENVAKWLQTQRDEARRDAVWCWGRLDPDVRAEALSAEARIRVIRIRSWVTADKDPTP